MPAEVSLHLFPKGAHMKVRIGTRVGAGLIAAALLAMAGCWGSGPSRVYPQGIASNAAQKAMELYDTNKDGVLDAAELEKAPGLKAALKEVDKNGDGKISADEINARIEAWKQSKVGRLSMECSVLHNGQPLAGATVKFVPESFLGSELKEGSGATDANGFARISMAISGPDDLPGMSPGFYRVEITKSGENIPAKYNTETVLGQEVAKDAAGSQQGVKFDLKY
jgi:hypothetical protein